MAGSITSIAELETLYGVPNEASTVKEVSRLTPHYRALIEASPFVALATVGPEGLDCSPRGDRGGCVTVLDDRTLALPDRRGNNRIDSLRNVVRDPRVALLFLIPGSGTTFRVNGQAVLTADPAVVERFTVEGGRPRSVMLVTIEACYFQCARAIVRSALWDVASRADPARLPTPGQMLAAMSDDRVGGPAYDAEWPARAAASLW